MAERQVAGRDPNASGSSDLAPGRRSGTTISPWRSSRDVTGPAARSGVPSRQAGSEWAMAAPKPVGLRGSKRTRLGNGCPVPGGAVDPLVAGEVKSLSARVPKATIRIAEDIQAVQGIAGDVVFSLGGIARSITSVREAVSGVTLAVEQQAQATREISASMQVASQGVSDIDRSLQTLTR